MRRILMEQVTWARITACEGIVARLGEWGFAVVEDWAAAQVVDGEGSLVATSVHPDRLVRLRMVAAQVQLQLELLGEQVAADGGWVATAAMDCETSELTDRQLEAFAGRVG